MILLTLIEKIRRKIMSKTGDDAHSKAEPKPAAHHAPGSPPPPDPEEDLEKKIEDLRALQNHPDITREEFGKLSEKIVALMEEFEGKKHEKSSHPKHPS